MNKTKILVGSSILKTIVGTIVPDLFSSSIDDAIDYSAELLLEKSGESTDPVLKKVYEAFQRNPKLREAYEYLQIEMKEFLPNIEYSIYDCSSAENLADVLIRQYEQLGKNEYLDEIRAVFREVAPVLYSRKMDNPQFVSELGQELKEIQSDASTIRREIQSIKDTFQSGSEYVAIERTQDFKKHWDKNMFLNDYDERSENRGTNIKLSSLYMLSNYIWKNNINESTDLMDLLLKKLEKPLLVLGQPGIGKSTLITWLLNHIESTVYSDIYVFRFPELKIEDWDKSKSLKDFLLKRIKLENKNLHNALLILDGFDEIVVKINRVDFLNMLADQFHSILGVSLLITCRLNYINNISGLRNINYITLAPWNEKMIEKFTTEYFNADGKKGDEEILACIKRNTEVFGIPLILYMTLASNVKINLASTIVDVYDQIFDLEKGIYNRVYDVPHERMNIIKHDIQQMSRDIAFWMFENDPHNAILPKKAYGEIPKFHDDYCSGGYFENVPYQEGYGTEQLSFIHRSMYEYFLVDGFIAQLDGIIQEDEHAWITNIFEKIVVYYFKVGEITPTISEYLYDKLKKNYGYRINETVYCFAEEEVSKIVSKGIHAFSHGTKNNNSIWVEEINCIENMMELLRIIKKIANYSLHLFCTHAAKDFHIDFAFFDSLAKLSRAIEYRKIINLSEVELSSKGFICNKDFSCFLLRGARLVGLDLNSCSFVHCDLTNVDFTNSRLNNSNMSYSILKNVDFTSTDLRGVNFFKSSFGNTKMENARIGWEQAKVIVENINGIIFENITVRSTSYSRDKFFAEFRKR